MGKPRFRLFAGPNGSGKTSLFKKFRAEGYIHTEFYINADRFEAELKKNKKISFNAYRVKVSELEFKAHITSSGLFKKIRQKGFIDRIHADDPQTNVARVKLRVLKGEHNVDTQTITNRIPRTISLLPDDFRLADTAYVIDNSNEAIVVLSKEHNELKIAATIPTILKDAIIQISQNHSKEKGN